MAEIKTRRAQADMFAAEKKAARKTRETGACGDCKHAVPDGQFRTLRCTWASRFFGQGPETMCWHRPVLFERKGVIDDGEAVHSTGSV